MKPFHWFLSTLGSSAATIISTLVFWSNDLPEVAAVVGSVGGCITVGMGIKTLSSYNQKKKALEAVSAEQMRQVADLEVKIERQRETMDLQDIAIAEATSGLMSAKRDSVAPQFPTSKLPSEKGRQASSQRAPLVFMKGVARTDQSGSSSQQPATPRELLLGYQNKAAL